MSTHLQAVCDSWEVDGGGYAELLALTRKCVFAIHDLADESDIPVGASKYGGCPDVPPTFNWPKTANGPMWFMCQINLAELPCDLGILPPNGLLALYFAGGHTWTGDGSVVQYYADTSDLSRVPVVTDPRAPDVHETHLFARSLHFREGLSLPWQLPDRLRALKDELDDYISFFYEFQDTQLDKEEFHQIGGHPFGTDRSIGPVDAPLLMQLTGQNDNIYVSATSSDLASGQYQNASVYFGCT